MPESDATARAASPETADLRSSESIGAELGSPAESSSARSILRLQELAGNQAVVRMLRAGDVEQSEGSSDGSSVAGVLMSGAYRFGRHPEFPTAMGQTYYAHNDISIWPSFNLVVERSLWPPWNYEAKPKTTDAAAAAWPVLSTPANEEGYRMPNGHPKHPGKEYFIRVSGVAAEKIVGAEAQHVADLDEGWALTGAAAKQAINEAAGEEAATGKTVPEAKAAAVAKMVAKLGPLGPKIKSNLESGGRLESGLGPMMDKSYVKTKELRDGAGKHNIPVNYVTTGGPDDSKVLYEADQDKPLDGTPTSAVVNMGTIG